MSNDVWYSYTATCTGTVTASLCLPATNFDTLMAAWSGSCGCLSEIACNDDACPGNKSSVTFSSIAGTTYYLSIGGFDGGAGNFGLSITCTPASPPPLIPLNDHCAAPQLIAEGVVTAGTTHQRDDGRRRPLPGRPGRHLQRDVERRLVCVPGDLQRHLRGPDLRRRDDLRHGRRRLGRDGRMRRPRRGRLQRHGRLHASRPRATPPLRRGPRPRARSITSRSAGSSGSPGTSASSSARPERTRF